MVKFLFGGGWWTVWYLAFWAGSVMFVILPLFMIIRDAVPKPAGPASLASVVLTMGIAGYLGLATLIDVTTGARLAGHAWWVTLLAAVLAAAAATVISYLVVMKLCVVGGYPLSTLASLVALVVIIANLAVLWHGRSRESLPAASQAEPALMTAMR